LGRQNPGGSGRRIHAGNGRRSLNQSASLVCKTLIRR
jgi:hypothetical protein